MKKLKIPYAGWRGQQNIARSTPKDEVDVNKARFEGKQVKLINRSRIKRPI